MFRIFGKIVAVPLLVVTSLVWLVVKAMITIYGVCYGLFGVVIVAALILFLGYLEWANVIAVILIAAVAFGVMFAGTFIQVLLEEANSGLKKFIRV